MAMGQWVTVPANKTRSGRPERRWQQPDGELMETEPVLSSLWNALHPKGFQLFSGKPAHEMSGPGAAASAQPKQSALAGRVENAPLTPAQLNALREGQNAAIRAYGAAPGIGAPATYGDPAARARESEARRMLQQATPFWEREENKALKQAADDGPRAGTAGYAQRADIQAWMDAQRAKGPAGQAMVDRFLEQQKKRGLLEVPMAAPQVDQLATPADAQLTAERGYGGVSVDPRALAGIQLENSSLSGDSRFENPAYGAETLRGMPVSPVDPVAGDAATSAAALAGYQQGLEAAAFTGSADLPNMAFVGNGMTPDQAFVPGREQDVPGITAPIPEPQETRELNLNGENALVRRYLSAIQGR